MTAIGLEFGGEQLTNWLFHIHVSSVPREHSPDRGMFISTSVQGNVLVWRLMNYENKMGMMEMARESR